MERKNSQIHVVVPSLNEEAHLNDLLNQLVSVGFGKVTVVDAQSTDGTRTIVKRFPEVELLTTDKRKRAVQMNFGAERTEYPYLLFLHADTQLSNNFQKELGNFFNQNKQDGGSFYLQFDSTHWFLKLNAHFSKLNFLPFQFGDQGLLVSSKLFKEINGFDETLLFMEGNDIIKRIKRKAIFRKIPSTLIVSARKYEKHGAFRLQLSYYLIYLFCSVGIKQRTVQQWFSKILR